MKRGTVLALLLVASPVRAGRTRYGWLPETETVPDGAVELATSIYERVDLGPYHERTTGLVWTPTIGLTPCLELAFPIELVTRTEDDAAPFSGIARYGVELRYAFLRQVTGLRPLARFAVSRDVRIQSELRTETQVAASYDYDRFEVEADVGGVLDLNFGHVHEELRPGLGTNALVTGQLRLGAELYAEVSHDATTTSWAALGPDVSWARGRFWVAGVLGVGIHNITMAPRLNLGMVW